MTSNLADVATAATYTDGNLVHQMGAFDYLQSVLTPAEHMIFTEMFRDDPTPPAEPFTPGSEFTQWVTPHIQYGEVCIWAEARRLRNQYQCDTVLEILNYMEQVRSHFGGNAVIITSGYRPPHINNAVGGASNSEHLYDVPEKGAIDFCIERTNIYDVERYVDQTWPYSVGYGASRGFVHVGIRPGKPRVRWSY